MTTLDRACASWHGADLKPFAARRLDRWIRLAAIGLVAATMLAPWVELTTDADPAPGDTEAAAQRTETPSGPGTRARPGREIQFQFYISQPFYDRSDLTFTRNDGTDLKLKALGWDGDALKFPIDGGIRSVEWFGAIGVMIDFLHNKAVARLGRGAHGRKIPNPVIDIVEAEGTFKGEPVKSPVTLTDIFARLEFTHGHNVLIFTPLLRPGAITPAIRPYLGAGLGVAVPHVEVWFPGEEQSVRTNEYQYVGPAAQAILGVELRLGKAAVFLEYKYSAAWLSAALTGDESWKNFNMPGDLLRQFLRWWTGGPEPRGRIETNLRAHQIATGAGYWVTVRKPVPAP